MTFRSKTYTAKILCIITISIITIPFVLALNKSLLSENYSKEIIYFGYDDSTLSDESETKLMEIVKKLKGTKDYQLSVTGYTDKKGNPEYNRRLADRRIASVVNFLIDSGIDNHRIKKFNSGSTKSFSEGDDEKDLKLNRRVEISIIPPGSQNGSQSDTISNLKTSSPNPVETIEIKSIIEHELKKIASSYVTFNVPAEIKQFETSKVEVLISDNFETTLSQKIKKNTYKIFENVSNIELGGLKLSANKIRINTTQENTSGRWEWEIVPEEDGIHSITLFVNIDFKKSNGTGDMISIPIMLKTVNIIGRPFYMLSEIYRKGLYLLFIIIMAIGIFVMISKKNHNTNIRK